jgi:hypothetical protein
MFARFVGRRGRIPYYRLGQEGRPLRVRRSNFDPFLASSGPEGEPVEPAPSIWDGEVPVPSMAGTGSPSQRHWASNAGLDRFGGVAAIRRRDRPCLMRCRSQRAQMLSRSAGKLLGGSTMPSFSFPRRQQFRRLRRAAGCAVATITLAAGTILAAVADHLVLALLLAVAAFGCAVRSWWWVRLAGRSRIGARSEDEVRRALAVLEREGWRMRHSLRWPGRGDLDSVAIAPTGIGFVIETKTTRFDPEHVERAAEMARWLQARRRSRFPNGARPVLCVVRAHQVQQTEAGVLVVSLDRLVMALRIAARTRSRPLFLSPTPGGATTEDRLRQSVPAQSP